VDLLDGPKVCTYVPSNCEDVLTGLASWDVAVQRIVEKGVPCIISAGNDGVTDGQFFASEASEAIGAISVGSVDNTQWPTFLSLSSYLVDGADETAFGYANGHFADFGTIDLPMYAISFDTAQVAQACSPLPSTTPDLSSYIVLIRRGNCPFDDKIANTAAYGAKYFMFYNNVPGEPTAPGDSSPTLPVGQVSDILGAHFISLLSAGSTVTIKFHAESETEIVFESPTNYVTPGKMSTYSSWGPTYEMFLKPIISAPGGYILSTWPQDLANPPYNSISGTSMAAPYIAGVVGLLKQVRGKSTSPQVLETLLATTASPISWNDGTVANYSYLAPVVQQGGQCFSDIILN
jgi:subtilisin family serine protease